MNFDIKKNNILKALDESGLRDFFEVIHESKDRIIIRSEQNICNGICVISLICYNTVFNSIYFDLGKLENKAKKENMLDLLNSINYENFMFKFYLDEDDFIIAEVTYIASNFDADEYVSLIVPAFQAIEDEYYSEIMRVIWS